MEQFVSYARLGKELKERTLGEYERRTKNIYSLFLSSDTKDWQDDIRMAEQNGRFEIQLNNILIINDLNVKTIGEEGNTYYSFPAESDGFKNNLAIMRDHIDNVIEYIQEKAIENYTTNWEEYNSLSVEDWKNGYKNTIRANDGNIIDYIYPKDFNLYTNFKYDLKDASLEELSFICEYLDDEKEYVEKGERYSIRYLDDELYDLLYIKDILKEKLVNRDDCYQTEKLEPVFLDDDFEL